MLYTENSFVYLTVLEAQKHDGGICSASGEGLVLPMAEQWKKKQLLLEKAKHVG